MTKQVKSISAHKKETKTSHEVFVKHQFAIARCGGNRKSIRLIDAHYGDGTDEVSSGNFTISILAASCSA
jgi:hypothetical protein